MKRRRWALIAGLLMLPLAGAGVLAAVKFTSTWAAPGARNISFKGQKVAALVMSDDMSLRVSAEEALGRELTSRGITGTPAYRIIPNSELKDVDKAKAWFTKGSVAGVVALRPVSQEKVKRYTEMLWTSASYSNLWGYYPYGWGATYTIGPPTIDTVVVVELLVYQVSTGDLVWAGVSESTNPKTLQKLVGDIVKEAAKKIEKQFR